MVTCEPSSPSIVVRLMTVGATPTQPSKKKIE